MGFCQCQWFCLLAAFVQPESALTTSTTPFVAEVDVAVAANLERVVFEEGSIEDLGILVGNPTAVVVAPAGELAVLVVRVPIAVAAGDRGLEACSVSAARLAVPAVVASAEIAHTVSIALAVAKGFLAEAVVVGLAIVGHLAVPVSRAGCGRGPSWSTLRSLRPS